MGHCRHSPYRGINESKTFPKENLKISTNFTQTLYNVTPSWVTKPVLKQLRHLANLCFYHLYYSSEISRLRGGMAFIFIVKSFLILFKEKYIGPLVRDILQNIENLISNNEKGRKAKFYFGVC